MPAVLSHTLDLFDCFLWFNLFCSESGPGITWKLKTKSGGWAGFRLAFGRTASQTVPTEAKSHLELCARISCRPTVRMLSSTFGYQVTTRVCFSHFNLEVILGSPFGTTCILYFLTSLLPDNFCIHPSLNQRFDWQWQNGGFQIIFTSPFIRWHSLLKKSFSSSAGDISSFS